MARMAAAGGAGAAGLGLLQSVSMRQQQQEFMDPTTSSAGIVGYGDAGANGVSGDMPGNIIALDSEPVVSGPNGQVVSVGQDLVLAQVEQPTAAINTQNPSPSEQPTDSHKQGCTKCKKSTVVTWSVVITSVVICAVIIAVLLWVMRDKLPFDKLKSKFTSKKKANVALLNKPIVPFGAETTDVD